ncbi:hypothetical protein Lal_00018776 [Lupinus albus]|nr:hypothetical protein Lal_00018776 [Lupinus albus]
MRAFQEQGALGLILELEKRMNMDNVEMNERRDECLHLRLATQMKPKLSDEESLIRIGERIENRFGSGKIKKSFANKVIQSDIASEDMKEETSFTEIVNQPQTPYFPHASCYTFTNGREGRSRQRKRKSLYDPIPVPYAEEGGTAIPTRIQPIC